MRDMEAELDKGIAELERAIPEFENLLKISQNMAIALREVVEALESLGEDGWSEAPYLLRVCRNALDGTE